MMEAMLRRRAGAQTMDERAATCRDLGARRPRGRRARRQCGTSRRSAILVHRYYDPATGSFLSVDPTVATTEQPYVYTSNDPVNGTDPMGLWTHGYCVQASAALFSITGSAGICAVDDSQNNTALAIINSTYKIDTSITLANLPGLAKTFLANGLASVGGAFVEFNTNGEDVTSLNGAPWISYGVAVSVKLAGFTYSDVYDPNTGVSGVLMGGTVGIGIGLPFSIGGTGTFNVRAYKYDGGVVGNAIGGLLTGEDADLWWQTMTTQYGETFAPGQPSWAKQSTTSKSTNPRTEGCV